VQGSQLFAVGAVDNIDSGEDFVVRAYKMALQN
jgi:hypothetical protein